MKTTQALFNFTIETIAGSEAMFADLGHFSYAAIQVLDKTSQSDIKHEAN